MAKIENALGKKIQITNSVEYNSLVEKYDLHACTNYDSLLFSINNLSQSLARYVGADIEKIKLLSAIYGLGQVDGGKVTYNYINSKISADKLKINELDVMLTNLHKIFPNCEEIFTNENFVEFAQLFSDNPLTLETQIIKVLYYLKIVSQNYKQIGKLDERTSVDFLFNEMQNSITNYKQTNILDVSDKIKYETKRFMSNQLIMDPDDRLKLDNYIEKYNNGIISKEDFVNQLNAYRMKKEKKNKVR